MSPNHETRQATNSKARDAIAGVGDLVTRIAAVVEHGWEGK